MKIGERQGLIYYSTSRSFKFQIFSNIENIISCFLEERYGH